MSDAIGGPKTELKAELLKRTNVTYNLNQTIFAITEDKLELGLIKYREALSDGRAWHTPLGVMLAVLPLHFGAQFSDLWGITKPTWQAIYLFALGLSALWLAYAIVQSFRTRSIRQIAYLIEKLRKGSVEGDDE